MTDREKELIVKLGLDEKAFKPSGDSLEEKVKALEEQNEMLIECLIEMGNILYS